ncbi:DUF3019 domain-containing protein [Shewanella sp. Isolate11]|uniref:DUF3019 domain-containing protein n=1 Tax=Shewanella sp. Isolate11 TaxID=2908530 RepID=UPI001EFD05F2|nr:DUF3019 domain-containing protein [Shewanella sp. Isolate11]MCG9697646.1 DUF3019 domain-containing protein [Shewanella sp. Isolate11]
MLSNKLALMKLLLSFLLLCSFEAHCTMTEVNVAPKTCAVLEEGKPCHIQLKVNYTLDNLEQTCIWLAHKTSPEQCFNRLDVAHFLELTLTKDTLVLIKNIDEKILEQVTIQIATYQPVNQRKRRGLNWNLL